MRISQPLSFTVRMKRQKSLEIELKNIINKIKDQDLAFGQYLEKYFIFIENSEDVIYLGKPINEVPHLPLILGDYEIQN